MRIFIGAVVGVVIAAVVAGFFVVGSPQQERLRRFDQQRIRDLQYIQSEITGYWNAKKKLPEDLEVLNDDLRGVFVPRDPQSGEGYVYKIKDADELIFELCATFALPSVNSPRSKEVVPPRPRYAYPKAFFEPQNWNHQAGTHCFERKIDKDFFKPLD